MHFAIKRVYSRHERKTNMIGFLSGKPVVQDDELLIITHGVGYSVHVSGRLLSSVQHREQLELFIYTHVREEALDLYGFEHQADKDIFKLLLSVSGVGPRIALAIAEYGPARISEAVQTANVALFSSVPRVGKKLAQKIIIELKPKLGSLYDLQLGPQSQQQEEVIEALMALGFEESDVHQILPQLTISEELSTAETIKAAIKLMTQRSHGR